MNMINCKTAFLPPFFYLNTSILVISSLIILALTIFFFRAWSFWMSYICKEKLQILGLDVEKRKNSSWNRALTSTATAWWDLWPSSSFMLASLTYLIVKRLSAQVALYRGYSDWILWLTQQDKLSNESLHWKFASAWSHRSGRWSLILYLTIQEGASGGETGKHWQIHSKTEIIFYGVFRLKSVTQETDSLYWSKWCWKINSPLHHEQTDRKGQGIKVINRVGVERLRATILKQKIELPSQIDCWRTGRFWTFSLQSRSTETRKIGKKSEKPWPI